MDLLKINNLKIPVKIAVTEDEFLTGLMYQKKAFPMVFPYNKVQDVCFWMKNTPCELDIIFCEKNRITKIAYGEPFSLRKIIGRADLIIELPKNFIDLKIGQPVGLTYSLTTLAKKYDHLLKNNSPITV